MPEGPYWFDPFWSPSPWPPVNPWVFPRRPPRPPTDPDVKRAVAAIKATKKPRPFSDFLPSSINPAIYRKGDAEALLKPEDYFSKAYLDEIEKAQKPKAVYSSRGLAGSTPVARAIAAAAALWAVNFTPRSGVLPTINDPDTRPSGSIFTGDPFEPFWRLDELLKRTGVRYKRTNRPGKTRTGPGLPPSQPVVIEERPPLPDYDDTGRRILPGDWVHEGWEVDSYDPSAPEGKRIKGHKTRTVIDEKPPFTEEEYEGTDSQVEGVPYPYRKAGFSEGAHTRTVEEAFKKPAKPSAWSTIGNVFLQHLPDVAKLLARPPKINISQPAQFAATPPDLLPTAYLPQRGADTGADFAALTFPQPFPQPSSRRTSRTEECECAPKKKKRKKGCVNPVISRTTREGIRTTKTRIVCQPSKRK